MSVKAIQPSLDAKRNKNRAQNSNEQNQPSFKGAGNPVITVMDAIDRGGFAASFIAQDGIGMVAPRIYEGLNRNRKKDENGNKTGPLNWEFARREGVREILSGPSAFLIPAAILTVIKKASGTANNVYVSHINALGKHFEKYASANKEKLVNTAQARKEFYEVVLKDTLSASTHGELKGEALDKTAKEFTQRLIEIEKSKSKGFLNTMIGKKVENSAQDRTTELVDKFMKIRKNLLSPSNNELTAKMTIEGSDKPLETNFKRLISSLKDYTDDALSSTNKFLNKSKEGDVKGFVNQFNSRRIGTRVMSVFGMFLAVVGFYTIIPKLYNLGIKKDPGLAGLEDEDQPNQTVAESNSTKTENKEKKVDPKQLTQETTEKSVDNSDTNNKGAKDSKKDVAFTGGMQSVATKTGESVMKNSFLQKAVSKFEFNGPSMPVPAMLTLLFGFCFPPRLIHAKSDKEKKEIVVRDLSSFTAILFGAKALARGFSDLFAKLSGLALNTKPESHKNSIFNKFKNYFTPGTGVDVLNSEQIISKYSNLEQYKDGISGFFEFLEGNGGNVKKVMGLDKIVKENAEKILGKSIKDVSSEEIKAAFKNVKDKDALAKIYKQFEGSSNKFIKRAKTFNSAFGFASTLILVPAFMIWLAKYCENMTKKAVAKEKAEKEATEVKQPKAEQLLDNPSLTTSSSSVEAHINSYKPTMEGFLKN